MSMTESLRKLLRKMGGSPSNGDNSDELVSKIADAYSGGAGGMLVVHAVPDTETANIITLDKTWKEIHDAMLSSGAIISFPDTDNGQVVTLITNAGYNTIRRTFVVGNIDGAYETNRPDGYPYKNGNK